MVNRKIRFYVKILGSDIVHGPYTFKEAVSERNWYETIGEMAEIYKTCVDTNGKEVK